MIPIITTQNMETPAGISGVTIARMVRKIAEGIAPLYEKGRLELGGNRVNKSMYEDVPSEELDFTDVFLFYRPPHWYSIARILIHIKLEEKTGIWFLKIDTLNIKMDKINAEEITIKIKDSFEKYKRDLPKKIKIVLS